MRIARCPNCREPTRLGRGSIFGKWECPACGAAVRVSLVRRLLKSIPILILGLLWAVLPSPGFPPAWARILALAVVGVGVVFVVPDRLVQRKVAAYKPLQPTGSAGG